MNRQRKEALAGWLYILPSFIILVMFVIIPIGMSIYFSFNDYNVIQAPEWVGLKNYITMFKDIKVTTSLKNTFIYTVITVPLQTFLSLLIASILGERFPNRFGNTVKSALFVPVISSSILVGTLWSMLLATDNGMINTILGYFGISNVNWLGQTSTALVSVCIVAVWKNIGYFLVIFYAGIMDIPRSYYEAAEVDGATRFQKFFRITLPCLKPVTYLVVTLGIIWSFQVFDTVYAMTQGGPGSATSTLVLTIYQAGFREYRMGYASSIAVLLFAVVLLINAVQKIFFKEDEEE